MDIVFVQAPWCHACHQAEPVITQVAKDLHINLVKLCADEDCSEVGALGIGSLPTTIVRQGGKEVGRWEGAFNHKSTLKRIQEATRAPVN